MAGPALERVVERALLGEPQEIGDLRAGDVSLCQVGVVGQLEGLPPDGFDLLDGNPGVGVLEGDGVEPRGPEDLPRVEAEPGARIDHGPAGDAEDGSAHGYESYPIEGNWRGGQFYRCAPPMRTPDQGRGVAGAQAGGWYRQSGSSAIGSPVAANARPREPPHRSLTSHAPQRPPKNAVSRRRVNSGDSR